MRSDSGHFAVNSKIMVKIYSNPEIDLFQLKITKQVKNDNFGPEEDGGRTGLLVFSHPRHLYQDQNVHFQLFLYFFVEANQSHEWSKLLSSKFWDFEQPYPED